MLRNFIFPVSLALVLGVSAAKADTVSLDGTTAGTYTFNGTTYNLSPYGGTLNGQSVQFICVDQSSHVPAQSSWDVTTVAVDSGPFSGTVQGNQMAYQEMAYLASQMLDALANGQVGVATAYQFAIWSFTGGPDPFAASNPAYDNASLIAQAQNEVQGGLFSDAGWEVVTPLPGQTGQEMLVQTTEPSNLLLLVCGMIVTSGLFRNRKRCAEPHLFDSLR